MPARRRLNQPRDATAAEFAAVLADALHELRLTHKELAETLGVTRYTIDSWTRVAHPAMPSAENLERLCFLLERRKTGLGTQLAAIAARSAEASSLAPIQSGTGRLTNLRVPETTFIGRERELSEVVGILTGQDPAQPPARLLTLLGAGGIGKTRLALQAATQLVAEFEDGIWVVELAALSDLSLAPQAVAFVLGIREKSKHSLDELLVERLQHKHALLVLDNCEHLLSACAVLATRLLQACPSIQILATSREALRIAGENVWPLPPLTLPDPQHPLPRRQLTRFEGTRLFIERAVFTQRGFALTDQNAPLVAQICQRLDGIPLAIELAAACAGVLTIEQIAARLDDRFTWLTGGNGAALPRHQTLRAAIDWSYNLLSPPERALFARLAVFVGGWTVAAAEDVCGRVGVWKNSTRLPHAHTPILDLLAQLVNKSLVIAEEQHGSVRYRMLETIREYALEPLTARGEADKARRQHAAYYLARAERAEPELAGAHSAVWMDQLESEHDNLRTALRWSLDRSEIELSLRLCAALWRFWHVRGHLSEGRAHLATVLAHAGREPPTLWRASVCNGAGVLARQLGDYAAAQTLYTESLALYRQLEHPRGIATVLNDLGIVVTAQGNYALARSIYEESLTLWGQINEPQGLATALTRLGSLTFLQGDYAATRTLCEKGLFIARLSNDQLNMLFALNGLGEVARAEGDDGRAEKNYLESLQLSRALGHKWGIAIALHNLGYIAQHRGDYQQSLSLFAESLQVRQELEDKRGINECLIGLACLHGSNARPAQAAQLFGFAHAMSETSESQLAPTDRVEYERSVAAVRAQLSEAAFAAAWAAGRALTMEQAIACALTGGAA